jgi:ribose transport system substrate-binding protein
MKPLHHYLTWAACALLLIGATGCKGSKKTKVAFVSNNPEAFWNIAEAGATKAAEEFGVELYFRKPSPGNAATQKEEIDTVLNRGVKAISVSVIDPKNQGDYLDEIASKVPLLTQDNDAPKSKRLAYIGTNNYEAGRAAGKLVKEALGEEGGTVIIFVGQLDSLNARQRRQGVIDELAGRAAPTDLVDFKDSPDGETFGKYSTFKKTYLDQPEGAKQAKVNAEEAIKDMPKTGNVCMVGLWAYNPPMILSAVKDKIKDETARKRVKIVGFDEDFTTLDGVRDGEIYATVVQDPYNFGYECVKLMAALAKGDRSSLPPNGAKYIPYRVIGPKDEEKNGLKRIAVDKFRPELEKLLGKK